MAEERAPLLHRVRARLTLSAACRDAAEYARTMAATDNDRHNEPGDHIRRARRLRMSALRVLDAAIVTELAAGTTWKQVAEQVGMSVEEARARWEQPWRDFQDGDRRPWPDLPGVCNPAQPSDPDPADLDDWYRRTGPPGTPADAVTSGLQGA